MRNARIREFRHFRSRLIFSIGTNTPVPLSAPAEAISTIPIPQAGNSKIRPRSPQSLSRSPTRLLRPSEGRGRGCRTRAFSVAPISDDRATTSSRSGNCSAFPIVKNPNEKRSSRGFENPVRHNWGFAIAGGGFSISIATSERTKGFSKPISNRWKFGFLTKGNNFVSWMHENLRKTHALVWLPDFSGRFAVGRKTLSAIRVPRIRTVSRDFYNEKRMASHILRTKRTCPVLLFAWR